MDTKKLQVGLTFDDILLIPDYAGFSRSDIDLTTKLTKKITLRAPFVSAPMDTVTESALSIALAKLGGIGIIHRNMSIQDQADEVSKVREEKLLVGAAVGASANYLDRVDALIKADVSVILVDSAHGYSKQIIDAIKEIKKKYKTIEVIAGNIATQKGAEALIAAGADGLRVGMGPGAICTTRIISGMGVPQITALQGAVAGAAKTKTPVIADGGIKYSGDMVKAFAVGASTVMMGSYFASTIESPGKKIVLKKDQVPQRFQSIFKQDVEEYTFKEYRGMGSIGAMQHGAKIKSEDEFHGKTYKDRVLVAEGVEGMVPVKGDVQMLIDQAIGGIKSGMYYVGAKTLPELHKKAEFIQITQASLTESHPHSLLITNGGKNY